MRPITALTLLSLCAGFSVIQAQDRPGKPSDWPDYSSVAENSKLGTEVFTFTVNDPKQVFAAITGTTPAQEKFELIQSTVDKRKWIVQVKLGAKIDREESGLYTMLITLAYRPITATLEAWEKSSYPAYIVVDDVNDFVPRFQNLPYSCRVREDQDSGVIFDGTTAIDRDLGRSGVIYYNLSDTNIWKDKFRIDPNTGSVSLTGKLDYETFPQYQITITAVDGATPFNKANPPAQLLISVIDVNDTPPVFNFQSYFKVISENIPINSNVVKISAEDGDKGAKTPVKVAFWNAATKQPQTENRYFSIDSGTGQISVRTKIDREEEYIKRRGGNMSFQVIAYEENSVWGPLTTSITTVTIAVKGVNDTPPT